MTPYRVVEPENISDDGFPSLSEYKFPGFKGIVTTVFAEHDGSMTPLAGLTYGAREFLRSRDDESRYENLRRELAERRSSPRLSTREAGRRLYTDIIAVNSDIHILFPN